MDSSSNLVPRRLNMYHYHHVFVVRLVPRYYFTDQAHMISTFKLYIIYPGSVHACPFLSVMYCTSFFMKYFFIVTIVKVLSPCLKDAIYVLHDSLYIFVENFLMMMPQLSFAYPLHQLFKENANSSRNCRTGA